MKQNADGKFARNTVESVRMKYKRGIPSMACFSKGSCRCCTERQARAERPMLNAADHQ